MPTFIRTALTRDVVPHLVATAVRAVSVHNTQPWRFAFVDGAIELRTDPARRLRVADPGGRELVISCGAALYNLELGLRGLGLQPRTRLLPDPSDPQLLAHVFGLPGASATQDEARLLRAITLRHTHRGRFTGAPPAADVLAGLQSAAALEGATLSIVPPGLVADAVAALSWAAEGHQHSERIWRAELARWAPAPGVRRPDGVPHQAYPPRPTDHRHGHLPERDFALGRRWGSGESPGKDPAVLAVLLTAADDVRHWLHAGMALEHLLVRAAARWVFARFASQALELPETRRALRVAMRTAAFPQMVMELGHATAASLTPRRPVSELLS